jgi:hypothetical protein
VAVSCFLLFLISLFGLIHFLFSFSFQNVNPSSAQSSRLSRLWSSFSGGSAAKDRSDTSQSPSNLSTGSASASSPATSASQPAGGNPNAANALKEFMKDPYKNDALWNQDSPPRHSLKTEDKKNDFYDDMEEVEKKMNRTEERGRPLKKEEPAEVEIDLSTLTFQVENDNNDKNQKIKPRGEFSFLPIEESEESKNRKKEQQQQQFLHSSEDDSLASASFINNTIRSNSALSTSSLDTTSSAISANKKVAMFTRRKSVMKSAGFKKSESPNNTSSAAFSVAALVNPTAVSSIGRTMEEDTKNIVSFLQDEDDEDNEKEEEMISKKAPLVSSSSLSLLWNNNNNEEEENQPIITSPPPPPPPTSTVIPAVVAQADSSASSFVNPLFALMNQKKSAAAPPVPPPPSLPSSLPSQTIVQSAVVPPPPPLPPVALAATATKPPVISAPLPAGSQPLSSSTSSTAVVNPLMAIQSQKQSQQQSQQQALPPPPPPAPLPSSVPATVAPKQTTFLSIDTEFGDKKSLKTPVKEEKVAKDDGEEAENNFAFNRKKQKKVDYYTPEKYSSSSAASVKPTTPINQNKNKISLSSSSLSPTPHSMVKSPVKSTTSTITNNYNSPKNKLPSSSSSQPAIPSSTHVVPSSSSASPYSPSAPTQHNDISYIERDESFYFLKLPQQEFRSAFQQKLQLLFSTLQLTPEQVKEFVGQNQEKLRAIEEREQREWKQKKEEEMEKVKQKEIEKQRQQSQQRRGGGKLVKGKGKEIKSQKKTSEEVREELPQEESDEKNDHFFEDFIEKHQLEQSLPQEQQEDHEYVHHELHAYEKIPLHLFVNHEKEDEDTDTDKDDDDHEDHYHRSHQNNDDNPYQQLLKEKQGLLESLNYLHVYYMHSKEKILFRQFESLKLIITKGQEQLQQLMKERNYYSSLYQTYQEEVVQKNNELFSKEQQAIFQRINSLKTLFLEKEYQIYSLVLLLKKKNMDLLELQKQFQFSERMNAFNQEELAAVLNTEEDGEGAGDDMNQQETHHHYQREDLSRNENINFHRQQRAMASVRRKESISMELQRIKRELSWKKQQMMSSRDSMDEIVDLRSKRSTRDEWDDNNHTMGGEGGRITLIDLDNKSGEVNDNLMLVGRIDDYNSSEDEDNDHDELTSSGDNHHHAHRQGRVIPSKKETRVNYSSNSSLTSSSHYR